MTSTVLPNVWLKCPPRWLVAWDSPCLVLVTVLVEVGPLTATLRLPMGTLALESITRVTACSTLVRGATDVRRSRRTAGPLLPPPVGTLPTMSMTSSYALLANPPDVLTNYMWGVVQNLVAVLTCITACRLKLARPTSAWATWSPFSGRQDRVLPMRGMMSGWLRPALTACVAYGFLSPLTLQIPLGSYVANVATCLASLLPLATAKVELRWWCWWL